MTRDRSPDRLFMRDEQLELIDRSAEQEALEASGAAGSAEDDARRAVYLERLRAMLPELRTIEGFPIGTDEDILALSDPPYYTACPNPFLGEFIAEHGTPYDEATDDYHREPFAADVSEGKNDPIYNAHGYHTKVPHQAIAQYILHYTKPGDVVLDGFCGTGMTGVARQLAAARCRLGQSKPVARAATASPEWGARNASQRPIPRPLHRATTTYTAGRRRAFAARGDCGSLTKSSRVRLDVRDPPYRWPHRTDRVHGLERLFACPECGRRSSSSDAALDARREGSAMPSRVRPAARNSTRTRLDRAFVTTNDPRPGCPGVTSQHGLSSSRLCHRWSQVFERARTPR